MGKEIKKVKTKPHNLKNNVSNKKSMHSSRNKPKFKTINDLKKLVKLNHLEVLPSECKVHFFSFLREEPNIYVSYKSTPGNVRMYNEDRITVILNLGMKDNLPIHYFGVFDGHAGSICADFLKNNLHNYLTSSKYFPKSLGKSLKNAFNEAEKKFFEQYKPPNLIDDFEQSGSCALVILIHNNYCYCANVGDSRAIYSSEGSRNLYQINKEHKPIFPEENERILKGKGQIIKPNISNAPLRVSPGGLSVK